jgi:hypothetical protein
MKSENAIVYLLNDDIKDKHNFRISLNLLAKNYLNKFPCDVICFHEKHFDNEELNLINKTGVTLKEIEFKMPSYEKNILDEIPEYCPHPNFPNCKGFSIGYRHMCRFFSGEIFNLDYLKKYKYIWRLDTDSFILDEINYNVFSRMDQNDSIYGYINIQNDHEALVKNLWENSLDYFKSIGNFEFFFNQRNKHFRKVFYTNFEIFKTSWFRDEQYQSFYKYIDKTAGIYKYRWGDHVIRYIGINCLSSLEKCLFFNDIKYYHGELYLDRQYSSSFE